MQESGRKGCGALKFRTEILNNIIKFLIRKGGELFFYGIPKGCYSFGFHLLFPHLDSAGYGGRGEQSSVKVSVAHVMICFFLFVVSLCKDIYFSLKSSKK